MKLTVNIPEDVLDRARQVARVESDEQVVIRALEEFASRHDQRDLIKLLGTFESLMTIEELTEMRSMD